MHRQLDLGFAEARHLVRQRAGLLARLALYPQPTQLKQHSPRERIRSLAVAWLYTDRAIQDIREKYHMPRPNDKPQFRKWVNLTLTDDDKANIRGVLDNLTPEELIDWMGSLAYRGYKFNFSYDDYSKASQVSTFCWVEGSPNLGLATSSRHPDMLVALGTQYWKLEHMLGHDRAWDTAIETDSPPAWD